VGTAAVSVRTAFDPAAHGFPFPNCFPCGKPVFVVRTPLGTVPVGDASKGLCGGMVFAALDLHRHGRPVPPDADAPGLHAYLARRLWHSFGLPWGVARIYQWMGRPDVAGKGVRTQTARREWPLVRASLDRGDPAPLMLIKSDSRNPWAMGLNHQVLATGYDENPATGDVTLHLYEPNYPVGPGDEGVTLRFNTRAPDAAPVAHSREGGSVRGFFLNRYAPEQPPAFG